MESASNGIISGCLLLSPRLASGVEGVTVTLRKGSQVLDVVASDRLGYFRFIGMPPGTYLISVAAVGYAFAPAAKSVLLAVPSSDVPQASVNFSALPQARREAWSRSPGSTSTALQPSASALLLRIAPAFRRS